MSSAKEGRFLLIGQGDVTTLQVRADPTLRADPSDFEDTNDSVDSEGQCRPVKVLEVWCAKMAQRDTAMTTEPTWWEHLEERA